MNLSMIAALAYGILAIVGGIIGYIQAKSKVSLLSGSISGLLLILAAYFQFQGQTWGSILAVLITAVLVVVFGFRLAKTRKFMPAGLMTILGILALAVMVNQFVALRTFS
ncbi:TMEM14 family protein [Nostoc sp.]|uniref:TMEM14 family protein n=1 Tax=Nostoc sp. TaxID=1180 RepID=UPI002FFC095F